MKKNKPNNPAKKKPSNKSRIWIFRIISFSIPFIFFLFLETGLRLVDYGQSLPLFTNTPDSKNYILARPDIIKRYFPATADIPNVTMEANLFLKHKPEDGLRIFVQGGSTAAGFPYGLGASPAGMLDQRLKKTFPNRTVEVINTAMSAVNSYTLLDFSDEIIEQEPDAVLIYAGHNEFLGILGVGSNYTTANSHAANLMFLKLRGFRTFQWLQNIYAKLTTENSIAKNEPSKSQLATKRTLMSKVAKHKTIALDSDIYQQGLEQFEGNLNLLLNKYKKARIPVFISTIASNIREHKPFSSVKIDSNDRELLNQLNQNLQSVTNTPNLNAVLNQLIQQLKQKAKTTNNAFLHFELAKFFEQTKQYKKAQEHYLQAREHDLLRFRAPEAINKVIKKLVINNNAFLVDYEKNLVKSSVNGLVGNNFMLEHLHPNLPGYFILADSFYQALKKHQLFGSWKNAVKTSQAWKERPILPAEEYAGFSKIVQLKSDYPFTDKPQKFTLPKPANSYQLLGMQYFSKSISWLNMINGSFKGYLEEKNIPMILKSSKIIADAMPQNVDANFRVGRQLLQENKALEASIYFKRAVLEQPNKAIYTLALAKSLVMGKRLNSAQKLLQTFLTKKPENKEALNLLKQINSKLGLIQDRVGVN